MAQNTRLSDLGAWLAVPPALKSTAGQLSEQAQIALRDFVLALGNRINGLISFGSSWSPGQWAGNIDGQQEEIITDPTPGTEFPFYHGLGRVPIGRIVLDQDSDGFLKGSSRASWTEEKMYFKSDAASAKFYVVIV